MSTTKTTEQQHVLVIGAGVIGLTFAYLLTSGAGSEEFKVTIVARDMPEDLDSQAFASPWAGANWSPMQYDERLHNWEKHTFDRLWDMIPTGLIMYIFEEEDIENELWWKDLVRNMRSLEVDASLPSNIRKAVEFDTVSLNPGTYLPWLKSELLARGVEFVKHRLVSLNEVLTLANDAVAVVNATGLGARSLIGVEDAKVFPIRGQTIVAIAPKAHEFVTLIPKVKSEHATYLIPRPAPPGMVLLGGTFQRNNWDTSVDTDTARGILERAKALVPSLGDPDTRIISHNVGLRPAREGGPRVETEFINLPLKGELVPNLSEAGELDAKKVLVVHAYGFGPAGYQQSWGAAAEVVSLLKAELSA